MKKATILFLILIILPFYVISQTIEDIDYISPFNNELSAIKKGNQWAFINTEGSIVINFRDDLVSTKTNKANYPIFKNNRCLISKKKDGISYFGYIDKTGKTIVEPRFLNATNFDNNIAFALELMREDIGKNKLNKQVYYYKYFEVLINTDGKITKYLEPDNPTYIALDKTELSVPPKIISKLLSSKVFAIQSKTKKWKIVQIK